MNSSMHLGITLTADGRNAEANIGKVVKNIEQVGNSSKKAAQSLGGIEKATQGLGNAATTAGRALATLGVAFSARSLIQTADAYSGIVAKLKLVSGSTAEFAAAQSRLFEISQRNMTPLAETVQLYSRLATSMRDMGRSQAETLAITDLVGKSIRISGADASSAAAGILQFSQAIGSGVLRGDEFNSMMENSPRLAKALADGLNVPIGALRKMAEQGELTADKVINAILSQSDAIKREYTTMPVTVSGAFQQIQNALTQYVGQTDQASGSSRELAESLSLIAKNLTTILDPFAKMVSTMVTGWAKIADSIKQVRIALGDLQAYKEQFGVNQAISKEDWLARGGAGSNYSTGGGFGAGESGQFFDGVKRGAEGAAKSYIEAANAAWKLTAAQKAVVEQIVQIGEAKGFDPAFLLSIAKAETQLGGMKRMVSSTGAQGIFQFMPGTARAMGVKDPWNLQQATEGAIKYLSKLKAEFKSVGLAAAGYNAGEGAVRKYGNNVPPYKETQTYVRRVLANMQDLQRAMGQSTGDVSKELAKANQDQYKSYAEHLKLREKAFDDYTKVELAKQRTQMEQLDAARKVADDRYKTATAMGDGSAMAQAEAEQMRLIREKQKLLLDSIKIEEQATQKKLGNIGQEIAAAQKLDQFEKVAGLRGERASEQAELAALAERRKQIEINAQGEISKAMRDAEAERRKSMKQTADDAVEMARQGREAQEAELAYLQKQEQFRQTIGEQAAQGAKAAIDSQLQQQQAAMAGQKAERDAQLQNLTGLAQIQQARQNITLDLQDQLTLVEAEKQATQAKLAIDQQMLGYQEQMLQAQLASTSERERRLEIETAIAQIHLQQADNLRAAQNAATQANAAAAKAQSAAAKGVGGLDAKEVKERQLRENAFWDQLIGRAQEYANVWNQIGENSNDAFSTMFVASNKFIKNIDQISKSYKEMAADGGGSSFALDMAEGMAQAQNALNMVAQSLVLVRNQYEKGSAEYQKYDQAAAAVAVAAKVAAIAEGILAVVHQMSSGDPYSAIPRALAVAAMLASMGISTGASGASGGISAIAQKRQETQGTGTVFGDTAAQSESIANSLEIIKSNSSNDLNYSAAMLRALEDLSLNILALANQVTMTVMPSIDAAIKASGMKFGKQNISLFSGFNTQLTDSGIGWFETSLEKIFSGGFTAKMYADVTKSFEVMQSALSSETTTYVRNASKDVTNQIAQIFRDMVKALQEGGKAFGLSGQDILDSLKGFKIGMEQISLKDMSMEEQTAALNAVFSKITDKMAERINKLRDLQLDPFRKAGEGMSETLFRVAEGINRANGELERLNVNAINYKDILNKQGDPAAEIVRQSLAAQTQLSASVREYVNVLTGSAEDIIASYKQIISASNLLKTAGIGDTNLSQTMTNAAGGLDEFVAAMESFNENFLSQADRYAGDVRVLTEQFGALGYALPDSKDAFVALIRSIDTTDDAGKKLFGQMIALSESFAKVANEAENIRNKYAAVLDPFKAIADRIKEVGTDFGKLLGGATGDSQGRINAIGDKAIKDRANLTGEQDKLRKAVEDRGLALFNLYSEQDKWQEKLDKELAKKPKDQRKKYIDWYKQNIAQINEGINALVSANRADLIRVNDINQEIARITAQEGTDKGTEAGRLAAEKIGIIEDARLAMGATLEQIFADIAQTIQQAQQRLQSVLDLQKSLSSQLAQLQGPQAIAALANVNYATARQNIVDYIGGVQAGGTRNVETEVSLIQAGQQAIMDKYNAEIAAIQEAEQAYIAAETERLNAALQLQIDAINAATDAAIEAENDRLNAAIKAQQKIDQAAIKAQQKQFDAANKLTQKGFDAEIKAQQKIDQAAIKAQQKQFDAANKLTQKQFDKEQKALSKVHDAQLKALSDELDAANKLRDAIKGINDYVMGMALGGNSPLSPEQKLAEAQRQYQALLSKAQGGDADAMQKLTSASDAYLEASKQYYGSGTQYANTFDAVKNAMSAIGGMSAPDPDSIQSRIDALREAQAEEMDLLRESQAERLDAIRELQSEQLDLIREQQQESLDAMRERQQELMDVIREGQADQLDLMREAQQETLDAMRQASQKTAEEIRKAAQSQIEEAQKATQQAIADLSDPNKNAAMKAAREAAERDLRKLQELAELTRQEAQRQADEAKRIAQENAQRAIDLANDQLEQLQAGTRLNTAQLEALNSILVKNGLNPIQAYAKGGYAQAGMALVGEKGPEIVRFERPAQVMTADETRDALSGGNNEAIVQAIAELKAEMRAVVVTQSNANPVIIDKLSGMEQRLSKMERTQRFTAGA